MPTITVTIDSPLPPEYVLEAAVDFSDRRSRVFPAVEPEHFEVHSVDTHTAEATEGTGTGIGVNWERCRYDWSQPSRVIATVTDSNVYAPGSSWELTAVSVPAGAQVEMSWVRHFTHTPRGLLFATAFRLIGRPMFRKYAKQIIDNLETLESQERAARR
jgi:hypothetical protein